MKSLTTLLTEDGSKTCRHPDHQASYRSVGGAVQEVQHVFIDSTFNLSGGAQDLRDRRDCVTILELGFGLGTSMAQTLAFAAKNHLFCEYVSVEREPVDPMYAQHPDPQYRACAAQLLEQLAGKERAVIAGVGYRVTVVRGDFLDFTDDFKADAVYFDPFGPKENPESWTDEIFAHAKTKIAPQGRLATYSAAGHVRRAMAAAGWILATRPGPGRKREITVAGLTEDALPEAPENGLKRLSMQRYRR